MTHAPTPANTATSREQVYELIGDCIVRAQVVEQLLLFVMTYVLQKGTALSLDLLEAQEQSDRRRTLGYFLRRLRTRIKVDPTFDRLLEEFLDARNTLVHRLRDVPGWTLQSEEGRRAGRIFLEQFARQCAVVQLAFSGLVRVWAKQRGIKCVPGFEKWEKALDAGAVPLVEYMFPREAKRQG